MTQLQIALPDDLRQWLEDKAAQQGLSSASDFVSQLVTNAHDRELRLEEDILRGLQGPFVPVNEEFWKQLEERVATRLKQ